MEFLFLLRYEREERSVNGGQSYIGYRAKYYIHCTRNYILLFQLMIIIEHV